jgi:hypothetical protein
MINPLRKMIVGQQLIQAMACDLKRVFGVDADGHQCPHPPLRAVWQGA